MIKLRATDMPPVLEERLAALPSDLTRAETRLAQWLRMNVATLALETGASVATKTGLSEITVSRFLRRLGYRGMAALKADLRAAGFSGRLGGADHFMRLPEGELGELLRRDAEAVLALGAQIARPEWEEAVGLVHGADQVFVTGFQSVRGVAEDLARRLAIVRPAARFIAAHDSGLAEWLPGDREGPRRCLVLIDVVPYAREAPAVLRLATDAGLGAVVVTDELNTWAAERTPHVFRAASHATSHGASYLESTGPLATLLSLLVRATAERAPEETRQRLAAWPGLVRPLGLF